MKCLCISIPLKDPFNTYLSMTLIKIKRKTRIKRGLYLLKKLFIEKQFDYHDVKYKRLTNNFIYK